MSSVEAVDRGIISHLLYIGNRQGLKAKEGRSILLFQDIIVVYYTLINVLPLWKILGKIREYFRMQMVSWQMNEIWTIMHTVIHYEIIW